MSLQSYNVQQGYEELIRAHQATIRRVVGESHLARQVRPWRPVDLVSPFVAALTALRGWPAGAAYAIHGSRK